MMAKHECRARRTKVSDIVLDLGEQPACDYFPKRDESGPDLLYPLQMWLCSSCGLAQLLAGPTVPEEPKGAEPAALVAQAADAVLRVAEVREAYPEIEASAGERVDVGTLGTGRSFP